MQVHLPFRPIALTLTPIGFSSDQDHALLPAWAGCPPQAGTKPKTAPGHNGDTWAVLRIRQLDKAYGMKPVRMVGFGELCLPTALT